MSEFSKYTDKEISEMFAVEVLGWRKDNISVCGHPPCWIDDSNRKHSEIPNFVADCKTMVEILATGFIWTAKQERAQWVKVSVVTDYGVAIGIEGTFARAACQALILAKRMENRTCN